MEIQKEIEARINSLKLLLIKKAKDKGIYENFGQKEVLKLKDVFGYTPEIESFDNWCMTFDDNKIKQF